MIGKIGGYNIDLCELKDQASLKSVIVQSTLIQQVVSAQQVDEESISLIT